MKYYQPLFVLLLLLLGGCKHKDEIKPQRRDVVDAVFGSGHLEYTDQYTVTANAEGFLNAAYVVEGDTVKSGERLFRLSDKVQQTQVNNALTNLDYAKNNAAQDSPQIDQLKIQIAQAQQKLNVDSANYERYARLVKTQAVSTTDFENAKLTYKNSFSSLKVLRKNLADLKHNLNLNVANAAAQYDIQKENNQYNIVQSKAPGVVMNVTKKAGDYVKKAEPIALLGTGGIIIKLDIAEDDIDRVKVGQRALISLNTDTNKVYKAKITKVYPSFDSTDQSFIAEAKFETPPARILNGTQLQANIIVQEKKNVLVIPSYAVFNNSYVYTEGSKEKKKVSVGIRNLEWTEITGGLSEGDVLTVPKQQQ